MKFVMEMSHPQHISLEVRKGAEGPKLLMKFVMEMNPPPLLPTRFPAQLGHQLVIPIAPSRADALVRTGPPRLRFLPVSVHAAHPLGIQLPQGRLLPKSREPRVGRGRKEP